MHTEGTAPGSPRHRPALGSRRRSPSPASGRGPAALGLLAWSLAWGGCSTSEPEPARAVTPEASPTGAPATVSPPRPPPPADEAPAPLAEPTRAPPSGFGEPTSLDDRTGARVRNTIRARIGTRPTLVTSRHYRRPNGGTVTVSAFSGGTFERCVTSGTPREACLLARGEGALAMGHSDCVFGGLARIDIGPTRGDRDGEVRAVGIETLGLGEICSFEVELLAVRDEDLDGEPEVILSYSWRDLRHVGRQRRPLDEGSVRWILSADLEEQARLTTRAVHLGGAPEPDDRNLVTQLRFVPRGRHRDLALDVFDWLSAACPEPTPPRGRGDVCDLRERTVRFRYLPAEDRWQAPADAP